jgi:hypothetical protein
MRIGLITTLNTNIGDDFIREGVCNILRGIFGAREIEFVPINKHKPLTVYPKWHPVHLSKLARFLPKGRSYANHLIENFASKLGHSYFESCDLIVQCGAPVLWLGCHRCEWAQPLWHHVVGRLSQRVSVLNLAAGACYPWERQPSYVTDQKDAQYLQSILDYCQLTTVRDRLAKQLCASLGKETPLIPCSAFLAAGDQVSTDNDGPVLINYMSGGGHFEFDQGIDSSSWRQVVEGLIQRLQTRHKLAFLCHSEVEYNLARELEPTLPRFWPKTPQEYFTQVAGAKVALCNRMHASVGLANLGIPSIAVCTDTRLLMVEAIELPYLYVKEANIDLLEEKLEDLLAHRQHERERLLALRADTWTRYIEVVADVIQSRIW